MAKRQSAFDLLREGEELPPDGEEVPPVDPPVDPEVPPDEGEEEPPLASIVVQFDLTVWQPHDVYGRLNAFGGHGITYLEGAPNAEEEAAAAAQAQAERAQAAYTEQEERLQAAEEEWGKAA
jgi:hypothetical protein